MVRSMTGFGRAETLKEQKKITVELKSVNHKYLDASIRMPRKLNVFEAELRNVLKEYAVRGKVDIFISYEDTCDVSNTLKYNSALAGEYYRHLCAIRDEFNVADDISASVIARFPEVVSAEEAQIDEDQVWTLLEQTAREAFSAFRAAREKEGASLKANILEKLSEMKKHVDFIEEHMPEMVTAYRDKLREKVKELVDDSQIDENRIAAEVTLYADKIAIDEEMVRLKTHIDHMADILEGDGDIGRNLDFIAQEMNREANTTLSKSNDIAITNTGIELKTCIEKIREQVQNIE